MFRVLPGPPAGPPPIAAPGAVVYSAPMKGNTPERFKPISPNPFIVGNPVRDASMFFGRKVEFELARKRFKDAEGGQLLVFCGERRSGKTSILYQIAQGRLGSEYLPVLIDMQSMAIEESGLLTRVATAAVLGSVATPAAAVLPLLQTGDATEPLLCNGLVADIRKLQQQAADR